ncbi:hypothetical protein SCALIN_C05_0006 [Candidatus Scalindua japonica]|uniref:Antitoxin n=1 Tax=Candidatus Scalindua japonica TaxID=1284222 RepID=A0A286TVQ5_9BACT|nr:type II toxin-antitoxin system Phd/YefM family antitoxin [Candidatus Scalindua japonica]GAX59921.1 hypothetical protein SCALIN_C05_0006 [Candidatus Scalindua japonica]
MKTVTPTELRTNIYKIFDEIARSGVPVEINRKGKKLKIVPVEKQDKISKLKRRPDFIKGNPGDLVNIHWDKEVNLDLP